MNNLRFFGGVLLMNSLATALLGPADPVMLPCAAACISPYCLADLAGIVICYPLLYFIFR